MKSTINTKKTTLNTTKPRQTIIYTAKPRIVTKIRCNTVFQVCPPRGKVSLDEIDDALIASSRMNLQNKYEYFYSLGIDYNNVMRYFEFVKKLNASHILKNSLDIGYFNNLLSRFQIQDVTRIIQNLLIYLIFV